jgi:hypothetical protein
VNPKLKLSAAIRSNRVSASEKWTYLCRSRGHDAIINTYTSGTLGEQLISKLHNHFCNIPFCMFCFLLLILWNSQQFDGNYSITCLFGSVLENLTNWPTKGVVLILIFHTQRYSQFDMYMQKPKVEHLEHTPL